MNALATEDNILYNGGLAMDKGIKDLKSQYVDNYWELLPIERLMVLKDAGFSERVNPNPNFEIAETKSIKAIQKHSMNIDGQERNPQMDEAHLMLGKARYYQQRFVPALEAFNYVLYKYPSSDKIYEVKIWREKTNIRLDNDALAVTNLNRLLKQIKFKDQIFADANAALSQAFLNLSEKDSAVAKLKLAKQFTKHKEEKARYDFILGQLYQELGYKDSATVAYQSVIDMNRKAPREYIIQSYVRKGQMFDYETGDVAAAEKKYDELVADRENRPYLGQIYHQMGVFNAKLKKPTSALKYYTLALKTKPIDQYLVASTYRNMAEIYFDKTKYVYAGMYYDSTLVKLNPKTREFIAIKKKRENLDDVIKYEQIVTVNDSVIKVFAMPENEKIAFYEKYIDTLKIKDQKALDLKNKALANSQNNEGIGGNDDNNFGPPNPMLPPQGNTTTVGSNGNIFYFYNQQTLAFGKIQFAKNWGTRVLKDNWRISATSLPSNLAENQDNTTTDSTMVENQTLKIEADNILYKPQFYIDQLPKTQVEIDSLSRQRNFANYQLGIIYKEKFKENQLAANKFEVLLKSNPEERLILPSMYNLYKIYLDLNQAKATAMKSEIIAKFPDSRYAQILGNTEASTIALAETPLINYETLYRIYRDGDYKKVLVDVDFSINQYAGDELMPKFELLKANTIGKVFGLSEYKKALNFVALNYPNSEEGKLAEAVYTKDIPKLEKLNFYDAKPTSWKIVFTSDNLEDKSTKYLLEKLKLFIKHRSPSNLSMSVDLYNMKDYFIVVHGMTIENNALAIQRILKEYVEYKIPNKSYIITNDNYKIIQIKKNFDEYLKTPPHEPLPLKPVEEVKVTPAKTQKPPAQKTQSKIMPPQGIDDSDDEAPQPTAPANQDLKNNTTPINKSQEVQQINTAPGARGIQTPKTLPEN